MDSRRITSRDTNKKSDRQSSQAGSNPRLGPVKSWSKPEDASPTRREEPHRDFSKTIEEIPKEFRQKKYKPRTPFRPTETSIEGDGQSSQAGSNPRLGPVKSWSNLAQRIAKEGLPDVPVYGTPGGPKTPHDETSSGDQEQLTDIPETENTQYPAGKVIQAPDAPNKRQISQSAELPPGGKKQKLAEEDVSTTNKGETGARTSMAQTLNRFDNLSLDADEQGTSRTENPSQLHGDRVASSIISSDKDEGSATESGNQGHSFHGYHKYDYGIVHSPEPLPETPPDTQTAHASTSDKGQSRADQDTPPKAGPSHHHGNPEFALASDKGKGHAIEVKRRFSGKDLHDHIKILLIEFQQLEANGGEKIEPSNTFIAGLWKKEEGLTRDEISDINIIAKKLKDNNELEDILKGKNSYEMYSMITSLSRRSKKSVDKKH